jgi:hypothetical protein
MSGNRFDHFGAPGEAGATFRVGQPIVSNIFGVVMRKGAGAVRTAGRAGVEAQRRERTPRGGKEMAMVRASASCGRPFWAACDSNFCSRSD